MSSRLLIALSVACTTLACGGSTSQDSSTGGTAGSTGGGGAGGSGAIAGSGGGGAGSGGGGSGGASCAGYEDELPPGNVTLRFQNALSVPIYLGGGNTCGPTPLFDLSGPNGPVQLLASGCGNTCEKLQQHGDWCPDACMIPPVIMIAPGGHYDDAWSGTTFRQEQMPTACYFEPQYAPPTCERRVIAAAGGYGVLANAAQSITCTDPGPSCPCAPGPGGSCQIPYGATLGPLTSAAKGVFEMPGASLVVLTFQ